MKKHLLSLLVLIMTTLSTHAYDFKSGDLCYNITTDSTVEVTYQSWIEGPGNATYVGLPNTISIPETVSDNAITYTVTRIGSKAFWCCSYLTSVTIPNTVTSIRSDAFSGCRALTSLTIPDNVTSIEAGAFSSVPNIVYNGTASGSPWGAKSVNGYVEGFLVYESEAKTQLLACSSAVTASVTIPNSVTSISSYAFYGCKSMTSIILSNSITSIEAYTFYGCSKLTSINIPESVTSIGSFAFEGCSALTSINIPESVTTIQNRAFYGCSALSSITIPNSVTSIGDDAFYGCSSLPVVDNLRYADTYLVGAVDESLSTYTIKAGTKWIGRGAFADCSFLTSITIPNSVTSIGRSAFEDCSSLTSVTIPNSVTGIGDYAFWDCSALTSITIPNSVTSIGDNVFSGCTSLPIIDNIRYADTYLLEPVDRTLDTYTIKEGTRWIGQSAFSRCTALTFITIPSSVTNIEGSAFANCSALNSITIGSSVAYIGARAFEGCSALAKTNYTGDIADWCTIQFGGSTTLGFSSNPVSYSKNLYINDNLITDLVIPEGTTSIGNNAFKDCDSLSSVNLPNSLTAIGMYAFNDCDSLTFVNIPNSVTTIGEYAFEGCELLTPVIIPNSVTSIGKKAFSKVPIIYNASSASGSPWSAKKVIDCYVEDYLVYESEEKTQIIYSSPAIKGDIIIPNSVTLIEDRVFHNRTAITAISTGNALTNIGDSAFYHCSGLTTITIGKSVRHMGKNAFQGCNAITSVIWNAKNCSGWEEADNAPFHDSREQITSFAFGNKVDTIPAYICDSMVNLKEVIIPNSVKTICEGAFNNSIKLAKVTIGAGVETIEDNAFAGCKRLYQVYCYPTYPPFVEIGSFATYNAYLYIPCENSFDYEFDEVWGQFTRRECIGSEDVVVTDEEVVVSPSYEDVTITWPVVSGADTYSLVLTKEGDTFCTLVFNAQGQLVSIAFKPARQNAPAEEDTTPATYAEQTANGFRFTVTGLDEGTDYAYTLTVRNASNSVLETYTGEFTTLSNTPTGISDRPDTTGTVSDKGAEKLLRNGQVLIIRNGDAYDMMGQKL
ncbi:MAG: leucine-rich repeat domain-containing protein [Paludibacteraceae bacterium]